MEGSGFNARGSMGIPAKLQDGLAHARSAAAKDQGMGGPGTELQGVKMDSLAGAPAAAPMKELTDEEKIKAESEAKLAKLKVEIEEQLGCSFSEDDVATFLLKGEVSKKVTIIPGRIKGVFRTLKVKEGQEVDAQIKAVQDQNKLTGGGLENEKSILTLSRIWSHIQFKAGPADWAGEPKPFPGDHTKREEQIREMDTELVQAASSAWVSFNLLRRLTLGETATIKK